MSILCRVLTGPTASGKTALSLRLALENRFEILCMDSMQIYRRMDIGTAKPTAEERALVPHHLLDMLDPRDNFSVSAWRDAAEACVREVHARGREVLFVGGTGLYLNALMHPMAMGAVPADEGLRAELHALAEAPEGKTKLHAMLAEMDPVTAARLPENDVRRVIRAIEVTRLTGVPFSAQPDRELPSPFEWRVACTSMPREKLYARIEKRVDEMISAGLEDEVKTLLEEGIPEEAQSMAGLGYKEMIPYLRGTRTLEKAVEEIKLGTRHYAKRQMTFQRREPRTRYFDVMAPDAYEQLKEILL